MTDQLWIDSGPVRLSGVRAGDPAAPAIVLIHGYPDTKEVWTPVLTRLAEHHHVVAYDVRGAGSSSRPRRRADYDFALLGDDLDAVLDRLPAGRRAHLVGHDWGAIQGWEFATQPRFSNRLASFTAIAGPSLDQVSRAGQELLRQGRWVESLRRTYRSWYILGLLAPGGPTLTWRMLGAGRRWRDYLQRVEGVSTTTEWPTPTVTADAIAGAGLYRRNIPRRYLRPRSDAFARVPVQLIVPDGDRFISPAYYEQAERYAPGLRRRAVPGSHWAPRAQPEAIAGWVTEFVEEVEASGRSPVQEGETALHAAPTSHHRNQHPADRSRSRL